MSDTGSQRGLEPRLEELQQRIDALRKRIAQTGETQRQDAKNVLDELARRHGALVERQKELKRARDQLRQDVDADAEKVTNDLSATLNEFVEWVDNDYRGKPPYI